MKESFIFYASFYEAICELDDKKRLKMYDSIAKFALKNEEIGNLNGICKQLFTLIRPQILANNTKMERYKQDIENGKKGAEYGKRGGRPKKNEDEEKTPGGFLKNNPRGNPINVNENVNDNANVNVNVNYNEKEKKDLFINPIRNFFISEYEKVFKTKPYLSAQDSTRLLELSADNVDIREIIPEAIKRLKEITFDDINFTPSASWLLKGNNFERVMNGEFERKKNDTEAKQDVWDRLAEKYKDI